jgi:hypothetical protein
MKLRHKQSTIVKKIILFGAVCIISFLALIYVLWSYLKYFPSEQIPVLVIAAAIEIILAVLTFRIQGNIKSLIIILCAYFIPAFLSGVYRILLLAPIFYTTFGGIIAILAITLVPRIKKRGIPKIPFTIILPGFLPDYLGKPEINADSSLFGKGNRAVDIIYTNLQNLQQMIWIKESNKTIYWDRMPNKVISRSEMIGDINVSVDEEIQKKRTDSKTFEYRWQQSDIFIRLRSVMIDSPDLEKIVQSMINIPIFIKRPHANGK